MKVISFSLWGDGLSFYDGAMRNIELAVKHYPGWQCLFFVDDRVDRSFMSKLSEAGADVSIRRQTKGAWEGLFWRFEPVYDSMYSHMISRDCDSRLNAREAAAVNEWLASGKLFHSMRDHYEHNVPIMGGMFGCRHWPRFGALLDQWEDYGAKGCDQNFLNRLVWSEVRHLTLAHDRYAHGLRMPNRDGQGTYEYKPLEQLGEHDLRPFPDHESVDPAIYGEHVGARIGA